MATAQITTRVGDYNGDNGTINLPV